MKEKLSILVNSCDSYEDVWYPFFKLLSINWPDCKYPIYLNTETKQLHYSDVDLNIISINLPQGNENKYKSWSKRLYYVLQNIPTEFVLFSLEDFFLHSQVRSSRIDEIIQ